MSTTTSYAQLTARRSRVLANTGMSDLSLQTIADHAAGTERRAAVRALNLRLMRRSLAKAQSTQCAALEVAV